MHVDEGSIAFVEGSVFSPEGRIVPGARVDIVKLGADGSVKRSTLTYQMATECFL